MPSLRSKQCPHEQIVPSRASSALASSALTSKQRVLASCVHVTVSHEDHRAKGTRPSTRRTPGSARAERTMSARCTCLTRTAYHCNTDLRHRWLPQNAHRAALDTPPSLPGQRLVCVRGALPLNLLRLCLQMPLRWPGRDLAASRSSLISRAHSSLRAHHYQLQSPAASPRRNCKPQWLFLSHRTISTFPHGTARAFLAARWLHAGANESAALCAELSLVPMIQER